MSKLFIKNRDNNSICVVTEGPDDANKLAFVAHGLSGNKEEPHIRAMITAFLESGYKVLSYDAVHTFGESTGGEYEDATVSNYYADLEDVIAWAGKQPWYAEPFVLCGHSLGSISVAWYAENYPEKVKALAPTSTVVSGALSLETPKYTGDTAEKWKQDGILLGTKKNGTQTRLKWSHMEDRLRYDLLPKASKLTMPVLMVVGSKDDSTPWAHQRMLFDKLSGEKELHVIEGAFHSFDELHEQQQLQDIVKTWLAEL